MPPRVSPSRRAASTSSAMSAAVAGSAHRAGSASIASRSAGVGRGVPDGTATVPISTTWLMTLAPSTSCRNAFATAPSATRAAVSRAEARSRIGRDSSKPYFCMPARSACPGRGRVRGALRACASRTSASTGSEDITSTHLGHSLLPTSIATGPPIVRPCRTPPITRISSASNFIRAPRPTPRRRRCSSRAMSAVVIATSAGMPSSTPTRAWPCDSPAVNHRSIARFCHAGATPGPRARERRISRSRPSRPRRRPRSGRRRGSPRSWR